MTGWQALAPAKVNLTLLVGRPRADGYHPLVSVVQALCLADVLTMAPSPAVDKVVCEGLEGDNLALRALRAFREATGWDGPPQRLVIEKRIPVAAGMGGGSSDAAAALRLAAAASGIAVPAGVAVSLGADVPSLMAPGRVLMEGIGERVTPLDGPPDARGYLIVPSAAALSTPAVYREFDRLQLGRERLDAADDEPQNDLQPAALSLLPEISDTLTAVLDMGAEHALVSGSGPTVFGLFPDLPSGEAAAATLRGRFPGVLATTAVPGADFGQPRRIPIR